MPLNLTLGGDIDLSDAGRWPEFARQLAMKLNVMHAQMRTMHAELHAFRRDDTRGDYVMSAQQDAILAEVRKAKSVSESTNVGMREVVRLLKESQSSEDPAKTQEAIDLLTAMQADDNAILKENTPEAPSQF